MPTAIVSPSGKSGSTNRFNLLASELDHVGIESTEDILMEEVCLSPRKARAAAAGVPKIFSWVQNKLITSKKSNPIPANLSRNSGPIICTITYEVIIFIALLDHIQQPCKEEFSDWPHGLLAIGTFGNKIKQEAEKANLPETFPSEQDNLHGLTPEEVKKLQKELTLIFHEHVGPTSAANLDSNTEAEEEMNCSACSDGSNNKNDHDLHCSTSLVHSQGKDICSDKYNSKGPIGKKSLSFLLKKMFVCRSGFSPAPSLRDPIMESRMEKMLRTILHKKIYPQSSSPKLSTKKSLGSSTHIAKTANGNEKVEKADDGSKWVKTDSEYIVLEI
ncbi:hypothetical protein REPUB_Repub03eG0056600 [Reevesia pubescens]